MDNIQLVRGRDGWLVAPFTTQYESADTQVPRHFLPY